MAHRPTPTAPPRKQRKRARTSKPDRETLRRMYEDEHLTQKQIAAKLGAALSSVRKWMAEECIQGRQGKQAHIASAEDLRRMYHEEGLLQPEIAERLGVAAGTVRRWMAEAGIETRHGGGRSGAGRKAELEPEPAAAEELDDIETIEVEIDGKPVVMVPRLNCQQWVRAHRRLFLERAPRYRQIQEFESHEEKEFL